MLHQHAAALIQVLAASQHTSTPEPIDILINMLILLATHLIPDRVIVSGTNLHPSWS